MCSCMCFLQIRAWDCSLCLCCDFHIGIFLYVLCLWFPIRDLYVVCVGFQISKSVCASLHELIWLLMGRSRSFSFFTIINQFVACGSDNLLDLQYGFWWVCFYFNGLILNCTIINPQRVSLKVSVRGEVKRGLGLLLVLRWFHAWIPIAGKMEGMN